jgi:hypothetical protein
MPGVVVVVSFSGALPSSPERSNSVEELPRESGWQSLDDASEFLVLLGFASERAAQDDLRSLVEAQAEGPVPTDVALPSAVSHIAIEHTHGVVLDAVPMGGYLAVARTVASPGYGHEAGEALEETLSTFAQLPGYCGHLEGYNVGMEEEAWALVFGTIRANVPLPSNPEVAVRVYQRVS